MPCRLPAIFSGKRCALSPIFPLFARLSGHQSLPVCFNAMRSVSRMNVQPTTRSLRKSRLSMTLAMITLDALSVQRNSVLSSHTGLFVCLTLRVACSGCFGDDAVYTFSMHGAKNFPFHKVPGTRDVELDDGTGDDAYLALLAEHLPAVLREARPDLVVYLAGADPHEGDRLGRLKLTFDGLARRDWLVLEACREVGLPVCVTIAGGYGRDVRDTVRVHLNTVGVLARFA